MGGDGVWRDYDGNDVRGSTISIGLTWRGEVYLDKPDRDGKRYWEARLNTKPLVGFPTIEQAKSRVDWQIWNEMRLAEHGHAAVAARQETNVSFV
jgi:hypothetical protein